MKSPSRLRSLSRSITGIFVAKKPNVTRLNHKSQYFKNYYFSEGLCIGIDLIADQRQCSRKAAAEHLMKTGISLYMGELIGNELHAQREANNRGEIYNSRNLTLLRRYARSNNMDLSKFLKNKI